MKYRVDKYNLTRVYTPSKVKDNDLIHRLASKIFIFSVVTLPVFQTVIFSLRSLDSSPAFINYLSLFLLLVTLITPFFPKMSPIQ